MLNTLKSKANVAKRAVLEKSGKVQATQEDSAFQGKIVSLQATLRAFQNLQKVGRSIFSKSSKNEDAQTNPADAFVVEIRACITLQKKYDGARLRMDTAKSIAHNCAEQAKVPGKNQDAKNEKAESAKEEETTKIAEYEHAKECLLQGISALETQRDEKFQETIQVMCYILKGLQPDWQFEHKSDDAPPASQPAAVEQKQVVGQDVAQEDGVDAVSAEPDNAATDSESD